MGATGRLIRNGELAEAAREMTIASDLVSMLTAVQRAGGEARWIPFGGSVKAPALLVREMTVGGCRAPRGPPDNIFWLVRADSAFVLVRERC